MSEDLIINIINIINTINIINNNNNKDININIIKKDMVVRDSTY